MSLLEDSDAVSFVERHVALRDVRSITERYTQRAISTASHQTSVQMCLELLGSRSRLIPVVMSVTAPPGSIAAVLRAGAQPLLVDVDESTLQLSVPALQEVLEELDGGAVVFLHRPGGRLFTPKVMEVIQDLPTIIDARFMPAPSSVKNDLLGTFNLFDLTPAIGCGSLIFHSYQDQIRELKMVRSGILGYAATLPVSFHCTAQQYLDASLEDQQCVTQEVFSNYTSLLKALARDDILFFENNKAIQHFLVGVPDAEKVVAHLSSYSIESKLGVFPLHYVEALRTRWEEDPSYPVAEDLHKRVLALPAHSGVAGKEADIISKMLEVI